MELCRSFDDAALYLPAELRGAALGLDAATRAAGEEFRLRCGRPPTVVAGDREVPLSGQPVTPRQLELLMQTATAASAHTALESVRAGFVTLRGGHRLGLAGRAVVKDGVLVNFRDLSSLCLRVCRQVRGVAEPLLSALYPDGRVRSTLIVSPPGGGKTTLLRDLIRCASDGIGVQPRRVSVADERGELAALREGVPQLELGARTDVIEGCAKAEGLLTLLRAMNPQVLAVDEVSTPGDAEALLAAANCGVVLFATAHAADAGDLRRRAPYRALLDEGVFERLVVIRAVAGERRYQTAELERGHA